MMPEIINTCNAGKQEIDRLTSELADMTALARELAGLISTHNIHGEHCIACELLARPDVQSLLRSEAPKERTCAWTTDDEGSVWCTSCGAAWEFTFDGPAENGVIYCHKCGKPVVVAGEGEAE